MASLYTIFGGIPSTFAVLSASYCRDRTFRSLLIENRFFLFGKFGSLVATECGLG